MGMTLVKLVQHVVFEGDISDYLVENFVGRFNSEVCLENEDGELVNGELVDGYIEDMVIMSEEEDEDCEEMFEQIPSQLQHSYMNINRKQITLNDIIQLGNGSNEFYSIVKLNGQLLLCHHETKDCILQDNNLSSLTDLESHLTTAFPHYRVLTRLIEKSNDLK